MKKEKLVITLEIEDLPRGAQILDFQITVIEDHWLSRVFKNWKKISYKRALVTDLQVKKI